MNKIAYFTFFFYIIYNFNGYSQSYKSGKITYTVEIVDIHESDHNNVSKESKKFSKLVSKATALNCILNFSDRESSFTKEKKIKQKESLAENMAEIISGKGTYYTNLKERIILHKKESFGEDFIIDTPFKDWKLSQKSKLIDKYKCYKATATKKTVGRKGVTIKKITAWYTLEIPVNFGPKEYGGLPGLILELQEGNLILKAKKIELNPKIKIEVKKPTKGKKVTLKEYNKIIKDLVTNYRR